MKDNELKYTGERFVPSLQNENTIEHLHRYAFTLSSIADKSVLDLACGEGYGSNLMADYAKEVIGVDISTESIMHAQAKYGKPNLSFLSCSATKLSLNTASVDVVVSFETIEHLVEQEDMLAEIRRVLRPEGRLIISSPDKEFYSDATGYVNEFHLKELYFNEFKALLKSFFTHNFFFRQRMAYGSLICPEDTTGELQLYGGDNQSLYKNNTIEQGVYDIAVCSNMPIDVSKIRSSFFDGSLIQQNYYNRLNNTLQHVLNSRTYKLGRFLLAPKRALLRLFNSRAE